MTPIPVSLTNAFTAPWAGRPLGSEPSYASLRIAASLMVGKGSGLSLLVACCIWNSVAVELAMVVIASMHAFPQTMVQPGLPHSWQSRLDLVLHILASGLGEAGQGTLQSDLVAIGGLYQLSPAAPSGSLTGGSLRMQIPSISGRVLGRTSSLYLSSSRAEITRSCAEVKGYRKSTCSWGMWSSNPCWRMSALVGLVMKQIMHLYSTLPLMGAA